MHEKLSNTIICTALIAQVSLNLHLNAGRPT